MKKMVFISPESAEAFRLNNVFNQEYEVHHGRLKYALVHDLIQEVQPDIVVFYIEEFSRGVLDISMLFRRITLKFEMLILCEEAAWNQSARYFSGGAFTRVKMPEPDGAILQICRRLVDPFQFEEKGFYRKYLGANGRLKVLLIDPSPLWLQTASEMLKMQYEVSTAATAAKGLEKARIEGPDIIIIDLDLKDRNSKELYKDIRRILEFRFTPILFTSGDPKLSRDMNRMLDILMLRPAGIIQKPIRREELLKHIDDAYFKGRAAFTDQWDE